MIEILLDENFLIKQAEKLFEGATLAKKKVQPVVVLRNDSQASIQFNIVLKDGTVESKNVSIPPEGIAVVQTGGEINIMTDFGSLYENIRQDVPSELLTHADSAIIRAGIPANQITSLTKLTATPKQRIDQYLRLPTADDGASVDFVVMKPWGENGSLIPQNAKSGDVLVRNGTDNSLYFNSISGTLGNFVNTETGKPIPDELDSIKTAPLSYLTQNLEQDKGKSPQPLELDDVKLGPKQNQNYSKK